MSSLGGAQLSLVSGWRNTTRNADFNFHPTLHTLEREKVDLERERLRMKEDY